MKKYYYILGFKIYSKEYIAEKQDFINFNKYKNQIYWSYNEAYADLCFLESKFNELKKIFI